MAVTTNQSNGGSGGPSLRDETHHKHVRRSAISVIVLLPFFLIVGALWVFGRFMVCAGQAYELHAQLCEFSFSAPAVLIVLIVVAFGWLMEAIRRYGHELEVTNKIAPSAKGHFARIRHHMVGGYRMLQKDHQAHVRRTIL